LHLSSDGYLGGSGLVDLPSLRIFVTTIRSNSLNAVHPSASNRLTKNVLVCSNVSFHTSEKEWIYQK
jgi:hypothetical protein